MGQRHRVVVRVSQAHVHKVRTRPGKGLRFLGVLCARHVRKQLLALDGDLRLPVLAVVQHLPDLLHLAAVLVAAQHPQHPLGPQHVQVVLGQQVLQPVQRPAGVVALAQCHLIGCLVRDLAHLFGLRKAHGLVLVPDHMQRRAGDGLQHPHLVHRHGQVGAALGLPDPLTQPLLQGQCLLAVGQRLGFRQLCL